MTTDICTRNQRTSSGAARLKTFSEAEKSSSNSGSPASLNRAAALVDAGLAVGLAQLGHGVIPAAPDPDAALGSGACRPIALLANPESGRGGAGDVEDLLREAGAEVESFRIGEPEAPRRRAPSGLAVAGGDGSIGCAAAVGGECRDPARRHRDRHGQRLRRRGRAPAGARGGLRARRRGRVPAADRAGVAPAGARSSTSRASGSRPTAAEHADGMKEPARRRSPTPLGAIKAGAAADPIDCRVSCDGEPAPRGRGLAGLDRQHGRVRRRRLARGERLRRQARPRRDRGRQPGPAGQARLRAGAGSVEGQKGVVDERCSAVELDLPEERVPEHRRRAGRGRRAGRRRDASASAVERTRSSSVHVDG